VRGLWDEPHGSTQLDERAMEINFV
jgi:hypothetical protein